jgi:hypothetical protein
MHDIWDAPGPILPLLHEAVPERVTEILGPNGEPVTATVPRFKIGFDLRPRGTEASNGNHNLR